MTQRDPEDYETLERMLMEARPLLDQTMLGPREVYNEAPAPGGEGNVWEDAETQALEPPPQGEALVAQGMIDEMSPSMMPQAPDRPGNYAFDPEAQAYMNDPGASYKDPNTMDMGRGMAFSDMVGNNFYSPYAGAQAGEAMPLPEGMQGPEMEQYMEGAESDAPRDFGGPSQGMPSFELPPVGVGPREIGVQVGMPHSMKMDPRIDVEIGGPEIMPGAQEEPGYVPDVEPDPRRRRR